MANVVDTLLTIYSLTDNYSLGAARIADATTSLESKIGSLTSSTLSLGGALAAIAIGGLTAFLTKAVEASANFETLRIQLGFFTGGLEEADKKIGFIRQLSIPAIQGVDELTDAGVSLEKFGLRLERFLPAIAAASSVKGSVGVEALARAFGRLSSGRLPSAQVLGSLGLSKEDFIKLGVKFEIGNKIKSDANTALDAFKKLLETKYGGILDQLGKTTDSKLDTVRNKFQERLIQVGDAFRVILNPILDKLAAFLDRLGKDDNFTKFLANIGKNLIKFVLIVFGVLGFLLIIIGIVNIAVGNLFKGLLLVVAGFASFAAGTAIAQAGKKFLKGLKTLSPDAGGAVPNDNGPNFEPGKGPSAAEDEIAENTRRTAVGVEKQLDLRRVALGGGPLGQLGVTPIELYGSGTRNSQTVNVNVSGARNVEQVIVDIVQQTVSGLKRQGAL